MRFNPSESLADILAERSMAMKILSVFPRNEIFANPLLIGLANAMAIAQIASILQSNMRSSFIRAIRVDFLNAFDKNIVAAQ